MSPCVRLNGKLEECSCDWNEVISQCLNSFKKNMVTPDGSKSLYDCLIPIIQYKQATTKPI